LGAKVIAEAAPPAHSARSVVIMDGIVFRRSTACYVKVWFSDKSYLENVRKIKENWYLQTVV
jgi:hypothetical protein